MTEAEHRVDGRRVPVPQEHGEQHAQRQHGASVLGRSDPPLDERLVDCEHDAGDRAAGQEHRARQRGRHREEALGRRGDLELTEGRARCLHDDLRLVREHTRELRRTDERHDGGRTEKASDYDELGSLQQHLGDLGDAHPASAPEMLTQFRPLGHGKPARQ